VIGALLYLPLRQVLPHLPAARRSLGVKLYQAHGAGRTKGAACARCGRRFASRMQIDDLRRCCPSSGSTTASTGPAGTVAGTLSRLQARSRSRRRNCDEGSRPWLSRRCPIDGLAPPTVRIRTTSRPADGRGRAPPDRLVKTHCSFCGMQCGIQLKVRDDKVVGFEPWEEFPFNHGMLCPKGVKRYLQGRIPIGC
jgi:hypothetical protein